MFCEGGGGKADCGCCGWRGCENCVLVGARDPKPERSGVTVLKVEACCVFTTGAAGVGVDHEKAGG